MNLRTRRVQSMLTEEEFEKLARIAKADGRTISDYLRLLIRKDMETKE